MVKPVPCGAGGVLGSVLKPVGPFGWDKATAFSDMAVRLV